MLSILLVLREAVDPMGTKPKTQKDGRRKRGDDGELDVPKPFSATDTRNCPHGGTTNAIHA